MAKKSTQPNRVGTPPPSPTFGESPRWPIVVWAVALVCAVVTAYWPGRAGPFVLDDTASIVENRTIRSFSSALFPPRASGITVSGRPLLNLSLAANYTLSGTNAESYRWTNVALHVFTAWILFGLVRGVLKTPRLQSNYPRPLPDLIAACAATLWALHPLQTEAVTYVVQRAESLTALLYVLVLYCFMRAANGNSRPWLLAAWLACLAGMATKEVMASAPITVLIFDRLFFSTSYREAYYKRRLFYLGLAGTWSLLAVLVFTTHGRGGSVGNDAHMGSIAYLATQMKALALYLRLSLWPSPLVFDYGTVLERNLAVVLSCGALVIGLLLATVRGVIRSAPLSFIGATCFLLLAPSSSVVPIVTQTIAEHRMYLPLASIAIAVSLGLFSLERRLACFLVLALAAALGFATFQRNQIYRDAVTLWSDTVAKRPENRRAHNNLGNALLDAHRVPEAIAEFRQALALDASFVEAHGNLGHALLLTGKPQEALRELEEALRLDPANAGIRVNLSNALLALGRTTEAIEQLNAALESDPHVAAGYFNLANALAQTGDFAKAASLYEKALEENPNDAEAHSNYSTVLRQMGRIPEAITQSETAAFLEPSSSKVHNNAGIALLVAGRVDAGIAHLRKAIALDPNSVEARLNLAGALAQSGNVSAAAEQLETAIPFAPPSADLHNNLGILYAQLRRFGDARKQFIAALQVDPNHPDAQKNLAAITVSGEFPTGP